MFKYHCLNPIAEVGISRFNENYAETSNIEEANAILVRSAKMHDMELSREVKVIARAGAGVNNIPLEKCAEKGIVVFNTPGANANGVKELVIAGMLLSARDIVCGINWVNSYSEDGDIAIVTEKKKNEFAGTEIYGKKLGVIGLGYIGSLVANVATNLGMEVYGYDPYVSVDTAWQLSRHVHHAKTMEEIYEECDYISFHVPTTADTKGMVNEAALSLMKKGVVILNFARDGIVNSDDMLNALETGQVKRYVTDFPTSEFVGVKGAIIIPHLGASTEESEDNCAKMAVKEIRDFLENGNITNSVNYPNCELGKKGDADRITILHRNIPNMLGQFTALLAEENINISVMTNKSYKEYAYTMMDVEIDVSEDIKKRLLEIDGVLRVRVIK